MFSQATSFNLCLITIELDTINFDIILLNRHGAQAIVRNSSTVVHVLLGQRILTAIEGNNQATLVVSALSLNSLVECIGLILESLELQSLDTIEIQFGNQRDAG